MGVLERADELVGGGRGRRDTIAEENEQLLSV